MTSLPLRNKFCKMVCAATIRAQTTKAPDSLRLEVTVEGQGWTDTWLISGLPNATYRALKAIAGVSKVSVTVV